MLGCPWIVHVPEACTDFVHLSPPILNRVHLLIKLESAIEEDALKIEEVDQEFWEYLINNQWVIKKRKTLAATDEHNYVVSGYDS